MSGRSGRVHTRYPQPLPASENCNDANRKIGFWKRNVSRVPGGVKPMSGYQEPQLQSSAQSPSRSQHQPSLSVPSSPGNLNVRPDSSFEEFDHKVADAWDASDKDDFLDSLTLDSLADSIDSVSSPQRQRSAYKSRPKGSIAAAEKLSNDYQGRKARSNLEEFKTIKSPIQSRSQAMQSGFLDRDSIKKDKFYRCISAQNIDLETLRKLSWNGIPKSYRPKAWRLLCGFLPVNTERQQQTLERKREEYRSYVAKYYPLRNDPTFQEAFRQIRIDIPRTNPLIPLFQQPIVQEVFERVLFIWAMRHPASGYVQGINDLITPFFIVFLTEYINQDEDVEKYDITQLSDDQLEFIEADSYWCLTNLLDGIQDNYTFAQPGIQKKVQALKTLIGRVNGELHAHLEKHSVEFLQFAFRWMNNILMREFPLRCTIRLWDTYQAESNGFADFHLYVCAAFLNHWSKELLKKQDFQSLMILLQSIPTEDWTESDIDVLLAEAFSLKYMFADAPSHFQGKK